MLGMLQYGIRAPAFKTKPGWAEKVDLKWNFTENWFQSVKIWSYRVSIVKKVTTIGRNWGKAPISIFKFMRKWENSAKWWDTIFLIYVLANSDLELVEFEVKEKP